MNILILGYGLEGKSVEAYFKTDPARFEHAKLEIFDHFTKEELLFKDFSKYDLIFRTPSIPPKFINAPPEKITSVTQFFFKHCPCPIIGVTGTKGKGTTCTLIRDLLLALDFADGSVPLSNPHETFHGQISFEETESVIANHFHPDEFNHLSAENEAPVSDQQPGRVFLLGNIGTPALDVLAELQPNDVVVYELSSFQLWDLTKSPNIAVALRIEPDHLDVHDSFEEYLTAKQNITAHQSTDDYLIYFRANTNTQELATHSPAQLLPYPLNEAPESPLFAELEPALQIPGPHNRENAQAALLACFAFCQKYPKFGLSTPVHGTFSSVSASADLANLQLDDLKRQAFDRFLQAHLAEFKAALAHFQPLPHHLEFVRKLNGVSYYEDSFSTVLPSLEAALKSFPDQPLVLIAGGKDKGVDIQPVQKLIFGHQKLIKAVLIGETAEKIAWGQDPNKFVLAGRDFPAAIKTAQALAETHLQSNPQDPAPVVLLSPCASSFDMFNSYKERGQIFKEIVNSL